MPQQQQQQSGQDNSLDLLWIMALIIGAILLTWYFGKAYISSAVLYTRFYEITAIDFLFNFLDRSAQYVGFTLPPSGLSGWMKYVQNNMGAAIDFRGLIALSTAVGSYIRYPLTMLMVGGAAWLYFGGATHRFRHTYDTKRLETLEQENWPQIVPVVKLDLVNEPLDKGPWAVALSPMRFCKKYDLLNISQKNGKYNAALRRGAAYRVLSLQLGPKWAGVEYLPPYLKALFAIFAARINGDKKISEKLLDQISASAAGSEFDFSGAEELIRKYSDSKKVAKITNLHGYVSTTLASMLVGAREAGVLASSEFIWLKPIDRRMWYMLNSIGRPTATAEICGAFAHWLAEKKLGAPLMVPMVDEAIRGLEIALSDIIYKPEEEQ
ncbi:MAG: type IVB secretion system coupling complex protein DotM/IcmP [Gammaproteobacteria bacterium]|nr:type IVB secretion system coupling complex protein DotM/IcmP [Gammaproteobacteria bacterium]